MSYYITCLIIKDNIEIDDNIDFIKLDGLIFFVLDDNFKLFIKNAGDFVSLTIYFDYLKSRDDFEDKSSIAKLITIIEDHNIDHFILEHYFEFGDIPADHFFMMACDGIIINDSLVFDEDNEFSEKNYARMKHYKKDFGLNEYWFSRTDLF
ncbi:hypothetical protein [Chryseobacterium sp. sg2396]|uniref:hypothetical protein n=1 Tax=Chryseobacterium sp. sg2396 TaxID=3276280 RepID=UPI00366E1D55